MELSTRARYAVEAVIDLAINTSNQDNVPLSSISERVSISISYLEQLFAKLRKAGIVISVKGPKGGYKLGMDLASVTILDIITAVNETIETRSCKGKLAHGEGCSLNRSKCHAHHLWDDLLTGITNHLKGVTLKDIVNKHVNDN
ncbi:Rrf2 family transcriptional regulator [Rickettsiales bacterium LUAb2]